MSNEHKTAISRKVLSKPMRFLQSIKAIQGRSLDYGCGKGQCADKLGMDKFDPFFQPEEPTGEYDTITNNYVLNVVESKEERKNILNKIKSLLTNKGIAYISVRNDKKNLKGRTLRGTWQGHIKLDLPVVKKDAGFVMYRLDNNQD